MVGADKVSAIREKAEALAGHSLGNNGDALTEMTAKAAMAWCNREDIPEDMEVVVAALTVSLAEGREVVKSLTRGDTSVTYDTNAGMTGVCVGDGAQAGRHSGEGGGAGGRAAGGVR